MIPVCPPPPPCSGPCLPDAAAAPRTPGEMREAPALPGEAWRGVVFLGADHLCAIAPSPEPDDGPEMRAWRWSPEWPDLPRIGRWRERINDQAARVFRAAFFSARALPVAEPRPGVLGEEELRLLSVKWSRELEEDGDARDDVLHLLPSHAALSRLATLHSANADRLAYAVEELTKDREHYKAVADRLRHGQDIEGDHVCPADLRADAAEREVERLRAALVDAHAGLCDMRPYVDAYHAEKWGHDGYVDRATSALGWKGEDCEPDGGGAACGLAAITREPEPRCSVAGCALPADERGMCPGCAGESPEPTPEAEHPLTCAYYFSDAADAESMCDCGIRARRT